MDSVPPPSYAGQASRAPATDATGDSHRPPPRDSFFRVSTAAAWFLLAFVSLAAGIYGAVAMFIVAVIVAVVVYRDAKSRGLRAKSWALRILIFGPLAFTYYVSRGKRGRYAAESSAAAPRMG